MSNQNAKDIVSLKDHFKTLLSDEKLRVNERFELQDRAVQSALASAERAVSKAETATDKRFESMNEFRSALSDQTKDFMSRREYDVAHQNLVDKIDNLGKIINANQGRGAGYNQSWGIFVSLATLILLAAYIIFK